MRTSGGNNSNNNKSSRGFLEEELSKFGDDETLGSDDSWEIQPDDIDWDSEVGDENIVNKKDAESSEVSKNSDFALPKPTTGRVVATVFVGIIFSTVLSILVWGLYMNYIKYPPRKEIIKKETGIYCLEKWEKDLKSMKSLGEDSYIAQEIEYANGSENKVNFYKKMLSTIKYDSKDVPVKNIYGNDFIDRKTDKVVYEKSWVSEGEKVNLTYIDYSQIQIDTALLSKIMSNSKLTFGATDYNNKLVDVFCQYMVEVEEFPTKTVEYTPSIMQSGNEYIVTEDEDIKMDRLLFSSKEFCDFMDRFSIAAAKVSKGVDIRVSDTWNAWNALSDEEKANKPEPDKYNYKEVIDKTWCGVYYLKNEYTTIDENGNKVVGIDAKIGDGTRENPAGFNTGVITNWMVTTVNKKGKTVTRNYPIKVSIVEYGVSEDAINWLESKNIKNRGIDITSEVQYCYYVFEIVNMSKKTLTITDNSGLCDENANNSPRTGNIYGLTTSVTLKPDEVGRIESWNRSTELNKKYVIWGRDYARRQPPIWFRVLAGDIDDPSEDKGVTLNKTRHDDETTTASEESSEEVVVSEI